MRESPIAPPPSAAAQKFFYASVQKLPIDKRAGFRDSGQKGPIHASSVKKSPIDSSPGRPTEVGKFDGVNFTKKTQKKHIFYTKSPQFLHNFFTKNTWKKHEKNIKSPQLWNFCGTQNLHKKFTPPYPSIAEKQANVKCLIKTTHSHNLHNLMVFLCFHKNNISHTHFLHSQKK